VPVVAISDHVEDVSERSIKSLECLGDSETVTHLPGTGMREKAQVAEPRLRIQAERFREGREVRSLAGCRRRINTPSAVPGENLSAFIGNSG